MAAWSRTLHALPRGTNDNVARQRAEWVDILKWSRPAWQAAYEGSSVELVLAAVAVTPPVELPAAEVVPLRPARVTRLERELVAAA